MRKYKKEQTTEFHKYSTDETDSRREDMNPAEETVDEILARIEASAENIEVPEALTPEAVKEQLRAKKRKLPVRRVIETAAAVALVVAVGGSGIYGMITRNADGYTNDASGMDGGNAAGTDTAAIDAGSDEAAETVTEQMPVDKQKQVGDYHLASGYDEVYEILEQQKKEYESSIVYNTDGATVKDLVEGALSGGVIRDQDKTAGSSNDIAKENQMEVQEDSAASAEDAGMSTDYSTTNLQVEGVDESDFIKNDGSYLYVQTDDKVSVIDIRADQMKELAAVTPKMGASDTICDMYVDDGQLYVIVQRREDTLSDADKMQTFQQAEDAVMWDCAYYVDTSTVMELQTYDISDREHVKYLGAVTQDGGYYSSRKAGDYIYLFSRKDTHDAKIPEINGSRAQSDCIYIQDQANSSLIITSVYTREPDKVVDHMVLMNNYAQIYMGTDGIYLYSDNYEWNEAAQESKSYTDIAKFSYDDGILNGVAATSVRGTIQDVFAISESSGTLRVLTTEWKEASTNQLYLLDEKLELLGQLKNIAVGEEIYAARYIGTTAYFITYHNTDPLFAVDISDPSDPKMLGHVEITGFSDYLHPYGDGLLLGIGYETDPDTSERLGVKLVMFDISNPKELKILDSVTFDGSYCSAASDYKSALVSTARNLIGFEVTDWRKEAGDNMRYLLYSWDGSKFVKQFSRKIDSTESWDESKIRGLYAGERFYLCSQEKGGYVIRSYDMTADYKVLDEIRI